MFSGADQIAAVGFGHGTVGLQPVAGARADEHELSFGDLLEQGLTDLTVPVLPNCGGDEMLVHRERQRRGAAVLGEGAQHICDLAVRSSASAQFFRDRRGEHAPLFQRRVVLADKRVALVMGLGPAGEFLAETASDLDPMGFL